MVKALTTGRKPSAIVDAVLSAIEADIDIGAYALKTTNLALVELSSTELAVRNAANTVYRDLRVGNIAFYTAVQAKNDAVSISAKNADANYLKGQTRDSTVGLVEIYRMVGAADPYFQIGRDDTGVATNAVTDMLVLQAGAGGAVSNNFGLGISFILGNDQAAEVEERASIDIVVTDVTNGGEDAQFELVLMSGGAMNTAFKVDDTGIGYFDAAGAGNAVPTLFDHLDDAMTIREGIQQRNRELLTDIGVMEKKDTGSGHFLKLQPMLNLLGGGIYQNRARIDKLIEVLVSEFPQVAERLAQRNLLTLSQGSN